MWFTVRPGTGVITRRIGVRGHLFTGIIIMGIIRIITITIMVVIVIAIIIAILITITIIIMVTVRIQTRCISTGKVVPIAIRIRILKRAARVPPILIKDIRTGISRLQGHQQ